MFDLIKNYRFIPIWNPLIQNTNIPPLRFEFINNYFLSFSAAPLV